MPARLFLLLSVTFLIANSSCGGGDKHQPSANPPEYDPKKVYSTPAAPPRTPSASVAKPAEQGPPPIQLPPLEPGPNEKGEWKKVLVSPESLQLFKSVKSPCEALSKIVQGLGSAQLFAGKEGQSLKQSLGSQAESVARSLDQQLFDNFKAQLGPNIADCPSPVPGRKSRLGEPLHAPRRILATGPSNSSFQLAQATSPGGEREGYTITKGSVNISIPLDAVGKKSREWRIEEGNTPETAGDRKGFSLINGGYAKKCPTPDRGEEGAYVVEGDYEFSMVVDQTINYSGTIRTEYNARSIHATLKGRVDDDAMLQYVDLDASLVIGRGGTNAPTSFAHQHQHVRFVPDRRAGGMPSQFSNWSISEWDSALAGAAQREAMNTLLLAVMIFSGPFYLAAEGEWNKPNTCVEITFMPATKTKKFVPNESTPVKTELRTKKEQAIVPAKFKEAKERPRERNGTVSPREAESQPNNPATFTYQMIAYQTGPLPNWEPCTALVRGQGTVPMRVFQAFIRVERPPSGSNALQSGSAKIELLYGIVGGSQETTTGMPAYIDYNCVPNKPKPYSFWSSHYISGREEMSGDPMQMFLVKDWTYVGQNGVVATKTLRSTCGGMCDQEVATFTLREGDGSGASPPR